MDRFQESTNYCRIEEAILYLEEHAKEHPSLDEVAKHIGLSPFHFQRLFRQWAGVSPKQFLQHLTASRARELLRGSASVLETSLEVGLSGPGRLHDLLVNIDAVTPGEFKKFGQGLSILYGFHPTPFGEALIATTERGLCALSFVDTSRTMAIETLRINWREATLIEDNPSTQRISDQIFDRCGAESMKLLLKGTPFQLKVWEALLRIPQGRVVSYGDLAEHLGQRGASRAIGNAVGHNPVAYLIPCHRVLRSSGELGGYRWGTARKRALLSLEMLSENR